MDIVQWIGSGILLVIAYVIISNSIYLLIGSRLLQSLPGVKIKGFAGTVRLALMLFIVALVVLSWPFWKMLEYLEIIKTKGTLADRIGVSIRFASARLSRNG